MVGGSRGKSLSFVAENHVINESKVSSRRRYDQDPESDYPKPNFTQPSVTYLDGEAALFFSSR
jgi:hypothetical protein